MHDKYLLPKLSYAYDSLEPYIDATTMKIHHTKHHQTYIDKLNAALEGSSYAGKKFSELLNKLSSLPKELQTPVRNHGGGHANHTLFWHILSPEKEAKKMPEGDLAKAIDYKWGSFDAFKQEFRTMALGLFGSGWVWLAHHPQKCSTEDGCLDLRAYPNQDSPHLKDLVPLAGIDLWEHAYYLKHQNKRAAYINDFFEILNWETVSRIFSDTAKHLR